MNTERRYRYGARAYTLDEIRAVGRRHAEDGLSPYPPHRWSTDDGESSGRYLAEAEFAYAMGYRAGLADRRPPAA
jgi:hypothetical protein